MAVLENLIRIVSQTNGQMELGISAGSDPALDMDKKLHISTHHIIPVAEAQKQVKASSAVAFSLSHLPTVALMPRNVKKFVCSAVHAVHAFNWIVSSNSDIVLHNDTVLGNYQYNEEITVVDITAAASVILATKINFFSCNHHTGQGRLSGYARKAIEVLYEASAEDIEFFTAFAHAAGHWADTRTLFANLQVIGANMPIRFHDSHLCAVVAARDIIIRLTGFPAGTAKIAFALAASKRYLASHLAEHCQLTNDIRIIPNIVNNIKLDPLRYHIGSMFLTGSARRNEYDNAVDGILGRLITYIKIMYPRSSLAKSSVAIVDADSYADYSDEFQILMVNYKTAVTEPTEAIMEAIRPNIERGNLQNLEVVRQMFNDL